MKKPTVAIIGGTGREGQALALRSIFAGYPTLVGSRDAQKAKRTASQLETKLKTKPGNLTIQGLSNGGAAGKADIVFFTIPYNAFKEVLDLVGGVLQDKLLIDVIVPYKLHSPILVDNTVLDEYREHYGTGKTPSVTEETFLYLQHKFSFKPRVVAAFKTISFKLVEDLKTSFNTPILMWGFDSADLQRLKELTQAFFPQATLYEVPQMYWRSVEGTCEYMRYMNLIGTRVAAMSFSYG
ncbi:MAG: NADPH-dependent F420 reductase [Promethearchaeota archaeon]